MKPHPPESPLIGGTVFYSPSPRIRGGWRGCLLLAILLFTACGERAKPNFQRELAEFHSPIEGKLPYFKGNDMNPYWNDGKSSLPGDLKQLSKFTFTTHNGSLLTPADLKGKYVLMSFFFSRCSGICPMVTASVKRMREQIGDQKNLIFVSVSVDPEHDGARELSEFRQRMKIPFDNWYFTTGNKEEIYSLARSVFQSDVTVRGTKDQADFLHTESVYLLDKDLYLRGIYRTRGLEDMHRLSKELSQLRAS